MGRLDELDLTKSLSRTEEAQGLERLWPRLTELRLTLAGRSAKEIGPPVCVMFEGWDASGKGGTIKRLVSPLDPRHVRVVQFAAPTSHEKRHPFLWRFWPALPGWGGMAVLTEPGTAAFWSSGSRATHRATSGCAPTMRSPASSGCWRRRG